jgi:hypothetical protein
MRLRGYTTGGAGDDLSDRVDEIVEHPELAPNLLDALRATLAP